MSGANVPYQLRPNKFIDRRLFLEVLDFVRIWNGPARYIYASMGGRFLEDFKLIDERFPVDRMISIELDPATWVRQKFNCPLSTIECRNQTSEDFVDDFDQLTGEVRDEDVRFIVWLDYAIANDRGKQLQEYRELISKLAPGDVVKITLNANHQSIRPRWEIPREEDYRTVVLKEISQQLDKYAPPESVQPERLTADSFAGFIAEAVRIAALKGVEDNPQIRILPLAAFRYRDGPHQMLTVSAIVVDESLKRAIDEDQFFRVWPFRATDWADVRLVDVPDLSVKERTTIDPLLTAGNESDVHENLPFRLDAKEKDSLRLFRNYAEHFRRYPTFGRISY